MSFEQYRTEDARLVILRQLHAEINRQLNETLITKALEAFGHTRSREWVRTQLRKLEELGAVTITEMGTILIARLTRTGADHVEQRTVIEGVLRPSAGA